MAGSGTEDLFRPLELPGPLADAHALEQGDIELRVDTAVEVSTGRGYAALPLQHPEVLGTDRKTSSNFADVHDAVHVGTA